MQCLSDAAEQAIAAERAQLGMIGYPLVDRARPLNQRVGRLLAASGQNVLSTYGESTMKQITLSATVMCLLSIVAFGQSKVDERTNSERQAVENVMAQYLKAMQADAAERDKFRDQVLTEDYFYMGTDGIPVTKKQVMARQTRNRLRIDSVKTTDLVVRMYESTAILTMHYTNSGTDKGQPFAGTTVLTTVMVKQKGAWHIAADIFGREIEN